MRSSRTGIARWGPPLVLVGLVVLAWEAYVRVAGLDPITLPPPSRVVGALWDFREAAAGHLVPTLVEAITGCAVSVVLAVATAIALDRWEPVRRAVEPLLVTSQTIPIVAIAPAVRHLVRVRAAAQGRDRRPRDLLPGDDRPARWVRAGRPGRDDPSALAGGVHASRPSARCAGRRRSRRCSPGLRISVVYAVIGAIFGEYVGATSGLGIWMKLSQNSFRTDLVFAAILLTAIVSFALYLAVGVLERLVVPWAPALRASAR